MIIIEPHADAGTRSPRSISGTGAVHVHHHVPVPVVDEVHDERRPCQYSLLLTTTIYGGGRVTTDTIDGVLRKLGSRPQ